MPATTRQLLAFLAALTVISPVHAQTSLWLTQPDMLVDYVRTNADFWLQTYDADRGGFYTNVGRDGSILSNRGTNKDVLTQSRNAYAMVRAFQMTGDERYLDYARGALDFMYDHGWDATYGGWRNNISALGIPYNISQDKSAFIQHYALLGPAAMVEATGSSIDQEWFTRGYTYLDDVFWDRRPGMSGYYDRVDWRSENPRGKSFNATVDALTTHAFIVNDEARTTALLRNILERLIPTMPDQAIGFAEEYDADWNVDASERLSIMGHVLKTAWVMARAEQLYDNSNFKLPSPLSDSLRSAATELGLHVLENGYDHEYGGPYKDYDRITGEMQLWGLADTTKAWWQMEQAITAGLTLMTPALSDPFLDMASESIDFFMDHFQDPVYGEVYADRTRRGGDIPQWGDHKGDGFKAGYHSIELGFYSWVYANVFLNGGPFTMYYRFAPSDAERTVRLNPMENTTRLRPIVRTVLLEGQPYDDRLWSWNTLTLPPGVGGRFEVTYSAGVITSTEPAEAPASTALSAWPNPFSDYLHIGWNEGPMNIVLSDAMGRVVIQGSSQSGIEQLDTSTLAPGLYILTVTSRSGSNSRTVVRTR